MKKATVLEQLTREFVVEVKLVEKPAKKAILLETPKRDFLLEVDDTLYNPKYNGFHQLRGINPDGTVIISECCDFVADSKTTISNHKVKVDYLERLKPVYKVHKFMRYSENVGAWRVKDSNGHKSYLFYKDINVMDSDYNGR